MAAQVAGVEVTGSPVDRADELLAAALEPALLHREPVDRLVPEGMDAVGGSRGDASAPGRRDEARHPIVATSPAEHPDFLTLPAYARMP